MTDHVPMLIHVDTVRIAVSCESILDGRVPDPNDRDRWAQQSARDYAKRIADVIGWDLVDLSEEPEDSEYDSEWQCYQVTAHADITPEQWLQLADGFCMEIDWIERGHDEEGRWLGRYRTSDYTEIPALPKDDIAPTMGILGVDGLTPAVAVQHTDEGWGMGGYEPVLIASFYVAIALKDGLRTCDECGRVTDAGEHPDWPDGVCEECDPSILQTWRTEVVFEGAVEDTEHYETYDEAERAFTAHVDSLQNEHPSKPWRVDVYDETALNPGDPVANVTNDPEQEG